jgi:branched-subunit amino acid ABC-type transport system permease component
MAFGSSLLHDIAIGLPVLLASGLTLAALYSLIGVGFSLSFTLGKFFDLSLGACFLVGGYSAYFFVTTASLPFYLSMVLGVVVAGLSSGLLGVGFIAPLTRRLDSLSLFVATLALLYIAQALASLAFGDTARVLRGGSAPMLTLGQASVTDLQALQFFTAVVVLSLLLIALRRSRLGRFARAIADDADLALVFGLPVRSMILRAYITAGCLAGLAGVFYAADRALEPTQAMAALLAAMVATIIGGEGLGGAVVGACILAGLETILGFALPGNWKTTAAFGVLLIFLATRGGGAVVTTDRRF